MKSFKDIFKLNTGVDEFNTFDLSCDSVTTQNFLTPKAIYCKEVVPREITDINLETFVRMSPLLYPTFMRCTNKVRAFFCPFSSVWRGWNNFITGTVAPTSSLITEVPTITNDKLVEMFIDQTVSEKLTVPAPGVEHVDIVIYSQGSYSSFIFTSLGRRFIEILTSLGYRICWDSRQSAYTSKINVLPILCYHKVFIDWYMMNQYEARNVADAFKNSLGFSSLLNIGDIRLILRRLALSYGNYEPDYFTTAFSNPSGPSSGVGPNFNIFNPSETGHIKSFSAQNAIVDVVQNSGHTQFNQWAIDSLKALSDYMKRHQLVGSQAAERFMSRFGVKIDNNDNPKSIYLGSDSINIQIGDVMSTVQDSANDVPLGSFAGKGLGYGNNGHFHIESNEFGMVILFSDIVPHVGYVQGMKRHCMHINSLDFFTPEFEIGTQAIAMKEISLPKDTSNDAAWCHETDGNSIFGYTPRYAEYKIGQDFLNGNYIFDSSNLGEDAWLGSRLFCDGAPVTGQIRHFYDDVAGSDFLQADDANQYDRIFADEDTQGSAQEHFRTIYHLDVKSRLPMKPLFDNYDFESHGKELTMKLGGSTLLD